MSLVKSYQEPPFCEKEILRYAGCKSCDDELLQLLRACIEEVRGKLTYQVCYRELPVTITEETCDFECMTVQSQNLAKNLQDCKTAIIFAATLGVEIDRLIARYGRISPSKALMFQAIGAERIEALCDAFCEDIKRERNEKGAHRETCVTLRPRFSPGYGDLPLEIQKDIFQILDCSKRIGISLNDSLLMSPSKSVTAFVGLAEPEATEEPKNTAEPENTAEPKNTAEPETTEKPKTTEEPETTEEPKTTEEPETTEELKNAEESINNRKTEETTAATGEIKKRNKCAACNKTDCEYRGV